MKSLLICLALGALTLIGIYAVSVFPAWKELGLIREAFLMPGFTITALFWPDGIHSDIGPYWVMIFLAANLVFYALVWSIVLFGAKGLLKIGKKLDGGN